MRSPTPPAGIARSGELRNLPGIDTSCLNTGVCSWVSQPAMVTWSRRAFLHPRALAESAPQPAFSREKVVSDPLDASLTGRRQRRDRMRDAVRRAMHRLSISLRTRGFRLPGTRVARDFGRSDHHHHRSSCDRRAPGSDPRRFVGTCTKMIYPTFMPLNGREGP